MNLQLGFREVAVGIQNPGDPGKAAAPWSKHIELPTVKMVRWFTCVKHAKTSHCF